MNVFVLLWRLITGAPEFPAEAQPLIPPERVLSAMGYLAVPDEPDVPLASADNPVTVTVLFVHTSSAGVTACPQIEARFAEINRNSQIDGAVTVRMVGCRRLSQASSGSLNTDLTRLYLLNDGWYDEVHVWRNELGADLVQLIIPSDNTGTAGLGFLYSTPASAFSAVVQQHAVTYMSGPHEMGHNFGAQHNKENGSNEYYAYGYGWRASGWRTVMAYAPGTRIPYWSNPDVLCPNSVPCGTATADNARVLRERAPVLANFRHSPTPTPQPTGKPSVL